MASTSAGPPPIRAPRSRPRELEDGLNRFVYHPLSYRLARVLRLTGVSPNAVSVTGMLLVWGAAAAYVGLPSPSSYLIGFALHLLWHVVDGADGDLARMTGRSSPTGELVDGLCDYAGHALLYFALAGLLQGQIGLWAWPLGLAAAMSHVVQSNHAETQRRFYLSWVYHVPWLRQVRPAEEGMLSGAGGFSRAVGWLARLYLGAPNVMTPFAPAIDAAVQDAEANPDRRRRIAGLVRRSWRANLAFEKLLGANPRTIILGFSMALGSPLYFFLVESVLLNLLLVWSVRHHNAVAGRIVARIREGATPARAGAEQAGREG